jgi:hypothetical protein
MDRRGCLGQGTEDAGEATRLLLGSLAQQGVGECHTTGIEAVFKVMQPDHEACRLGDDTNTQWIALTIEIPGKLTYLSVRWNIDEKMVPGYLRCIICAILHK